MAYDSSNHGSSQDFSAISFLLLTFTTDSVTAMLYIIGLGLADERDISTRGLEIVRQAERVYLEAYTAVLLVDKEQLV